MQRQVVAALLKPETYDEKVNQIELIQTHISFIFLTEAFVYKVKKAVNLGFLDFVTLEKRRFYCRKELELNRRLCEDMYLEVVPINRALTTQIIKIKGDGEAVEYAVKMKKMPQKRMLSKLLEEGKVDTQLIDRIAGIVAQFHSKAETDREISKFGSVKVIKTNWIENFQQTQKYVGKTISRRDFNRIKSKIEDFIERNVNLFNKRIADGRIRNCHGDIHSGNIFATKEIYIFDAIEFNQRFRCSDVASDIAFLAMDLDFKDRADLSAFFADKYAAYSGDQSMKHLLPFYKCYRAYVRGKVISFRLEDSNLTQNELNSTLNDARAYFKLASAYSREL